MTLEEFGVSEEELELRLSLFRKHRDKMLKSGADRELADKAGFDALMEIDAAEYGENLPSFITSFRPRVKRRASGPRWVPHRGHWEVRFKHNGIQVYGGSFLPEEYDKAMAAYEAKCKEIGRPL